MLSHLLADVYHALGQARHNRHHAVRKLSRRALGQLAQQRERARPRLPLEALRSRWKVEEEQG